MPSLNSSAIYTRSVIILAALILSMPLVRAHGYVVRAIPADRSALERPPTRLQYWFSESLERRFSEILLRDQSGMIIASGGLDERNDALLSLRVPPGLPDGAYVVELRPAFASDGHVIAESRVFFVGEEVGGLSGQAADDAAIALEAFWRFLLIASNTLFFGGAFAYSAVFLPAWGSARYPGGGLPPRVTRTLRNGFVFSIGLGIIANGIALIQQSMVFFNTDAAQVLSEGLWQVTRIGSRFGDVWTFRMVLLVFASALVFAAEYLREVVPQLSAGIWKGMLWLSALIIASSMVAGHAAGSLVLPWVAIAVNWVHALAVAVWIGGMVALTMALPAALDPYAGEERSRAMRAVLLRFSRIAAAMVAVVIITGIYNALNYFLRPEDLQTSYGESLGRKLILAAILLLAGFWHALTLRPSLRDRIRPSQERRLLWLRIEVLLALAALAAVSWLSATPIPEPQSPAADVDTPQATQTIGAVTVTAAILPGGPGLNAYDTLVQRADGGEEAFTVTLQLVNPERGRRSPWHLAERTDEGLYVAAGDDIDSTGIWWSLIDVIDQSGKSTRAAFEWQISEAASVSQSRAPNVLHGLSLAGIACLFAGLGYPLAKRMLARLNMNMTSCLLGGVAVAAALAVMGIGAALIAKQQGDYERRLNPPPQNVNIVLPDADSLERGAALYSEHCLSWQGHSADFRSLRSRLGAVRDDFLYAAARDGWRDLPPCAGELSEKERWDIVNYFRTFAARDSGG